MGKRQLLVSVVLVRPAHEILVPWLPVLSLSLDVPLAFTRSRHQETLANGKSLRTGHELISLSRPLIKVATAVPAETFYFHALEKLQSSGRWG